MSKAIRFAWVLCVCFALTSPAFAAAPMREWTVLVWLNADNSLDSFGPKDLAEMTRIGSSDQVNVVVQMDRERIGCKRYFVHKGKDEQLADLGQFDMGDWKNLVAFANWGFAEYPAKRTMLIVWNHGSGWNKRVASGPSRGVSYDDGSGHHITTEELGQAMAAIATAQRKKLDVLGFDACLMNMFEVAYEVRESVGITVGSEETEPGDGWPYDAWLSKLVADPGQSTASLGAAICAAYASSYWVSRAMLSTVQCSALEDLRAKADAFAAAVMADTTGEAKAALAVARDKCARFAVPENADFFDVVRIFRDSAKSAALKAAADSVLNASGSAVAANSVHGFPFAPKGCNGLAIYFPKSGGWWSAYKQLAFAKASQWDELLQATLGRPHEGFGPFDELHGK